jgi:hypothetical protein
MKKALLVPALAVGFLSSLALFNPGFTTEEATLASGQPIDPLIEHLKILSYYKDTHLQDLGFISDKKGNFSDAEQLQLIGLSQRLNEGIANIDTFHTALDGKGIGLDKSTQAYKEWSRKLRDLSRSLLTTHIEIKKLGLALMLREGDKPENKNNG